MSRTLRLLDNAVALVRDGREVGRYTLTDGDKASFREWRDGYERTVKADGYSNLQTSFEALLGIGRAIHGWLEGRQWVDALLGGEGAVDLCIEVPLQPSDDEGAFLDIPWELIANQGGHLALDAMRPLSSSVASVHPARPQQHDTKTLR